MTAIKKYTSENGEGDRLILLTNINISFLDEIRAEIESFIKFMNDIDKKYAASFDKNIEKSIEARKNDIKLLVNDIIVVGGDK